MTFCPALERGKMEMIKKPLGEGIRSEAIGEKEINERFLFC